MKDHQTIEIDRRRPVHRPAFRMLLAIVAMCGIQAALPGPLVNPAAAQQIVPNPIFEARRAQARQQGTNNGASASLPADMNRSRSLGTSVKGVTLTSLPNQLKGLLADGGVPDDLDAFRLLETQQKRVARVGSQCTVGVKIGPAQGCGVIITESGIILTAAHVAMRPGKRAEILLPDGRVVIGTTLGMNREVDAGMIRIDPGQNRSSGQSTDLPWPAASLGSSKGLRPGMWCIATGHPGGYDPVRGPVTRVGRILAVQRGALVTDCALIGGDSGGPLFDLEGQLIAVHSRIGNDVADNLHVPIDHYDDHWDRLYAGQAWGTLPGFTPVLGVSGNNGLSEARVLGVTDGSPAQRAGIEVGDVIVQFGDITVSDFQSLSEAVSDTMPGERVKIWLRREGAEYQARVEIGRAGDD